MDSVARAGGVGWVIRLPGLPLPQTVTTRTVAVRSGACVRCKGRPADVCTPKSESKLAPARRPAIPHHCQYIHTSPRQALLHTGKRPPSHAAAACASAKTDKVWLCAPLRGYLDTGHTFFVGMTWQTK